LVRAREEEGDEAKLTRGSPEHEWPWLELSNSAEESERELRNEGKRCRGVQGWSSPFYRHRRALRRWWLGGNDGH
jgi:hypothetical protein